MAGRLLAALAYAATGCPILPIRPRGKVPITTAGVKDATTDPDLIRPWWTDHPEANLAAATGFVFDVLDVDPGGWATRRQLQRAGLLGGAFRTVRTPRGGVHVYLPPSGDGNHSCAPRHVDYRGRGGYVLVPPSVVGGRPYRVLAEHAGTGEVFDWDKALRLIAPERSLRPPQSHRSSGPDGITQLARWVAVQPEGNRNAGLFWAASVAVAEGHRDLSMLASAAVSAGLPAVEAQRVIASALRRQT